MNSFLDMVDRFKYGLLAALATYIVTFMYLQLNSYTVYTPIVPFHDGSHVEIPEEDIHLRPENIQMSNASSSDVRNITKDLNDERPESYDEWSYMSAEDVEQSIKDLEQEYKDEAGGAEARAAILEKIEQQKAVQDKQNKADNQKSNDSGNKFAPAGKTMVDWDLSNRTPHQNNKYHVRNPGYTCGFVNGKVAIIIKVNSSGTVTSATLDSGSTSGANSCMIEQAKKYALKSRFNYSSNAPKSQQGVIYYTFVSQ